MGGGGHETGERGGGGIAPLNNILFLMLKAVSLISSHHKGLEKK